MATFRSYPGHLKPMRGRGLIRCSLSGFLRHPEDIVYKDGAPIARDKADIYPGFGLDHPQDFNRAEVGGDPTPVPHGGLGEDKTKSDLGISDAEVEISVREGRPPRPGY